MGLDRGTDGRKYPWSNTLFTKALNWGNGSTTHARGEPDAYVGPAPVGDGCGAGNVGRGEGRFLTADDHRTIKLMVGETEQ